MSRIHDALLRAEQERARATGAPAPSPAAVLPEAAEAVLQNDIAMPAVPPMEPQPAPVMSERLTWETLQSRCARREWNFAVGRGISVLDEESVGLEELRTLRTRLYQLRGNAPLKTVLVASSLPGEGKTFLSCTLSQVIARQRGRRVLLIDGDLRLPRLHTEFGAPASPGLSEYLKGDADEFAILQRGPVEGLMLVPGGAQVQNPAELLAGSGLRRFLDRVGHCFDWIFIDSPAAVPIADASVLANLCDGVLMVVRAGKTPYDLAQKTRQEFAQARMLGVVINGIKRNSSYSSYYYRSYGAKR